MFASYALSIARRSRGFIPGSAPPRRAATVTSLISRVKVLPFLESAAAFLWRMLAHLECPDMRGAARSRFWCGTAYNFIIRASRQAKNKFTFGEIVDLKIRGKAALVCGASKGLGRGCATALAACPEPDILVTNAGGPPPGDFRKFSREDWLKAVGANMITPIELIRATVDGMISRRFGRIVNITSSAVKAPIAELALSNGARSGLTGFVAGLARKTVAHNR